MQVNVDFFDEFFPSAEFEVLLGDKALANGDFDQEWRVPVVVYHHRDRTRNALCAKLSDLMDLSHNNRLPFVFVGDQPKVLRSKTGPGWVLVAEIQFAA